MMKLYNCQNVCLSDIFDWWNKELAVNLISLNEQLVSAFIMYLQQGQDEF